MKESDVDSYVPSCAKDQFHCNLLPAGIRPQENEVTTNHVTDPVSGTPRSLWLYAFVMK